MREVALRAVRGTFGALREEALCSVQAPLTRSRPYHNFRARVLKRVRARERPYLEVT